MDTSSAVVFPAHAGMSRHGDTTYRVAAGFPRTRGDEPITINGVLDGDEFSPHTRG